MKRLCISAIVGLSLALVGFALSASLAADHEDPAAPAHSATSPEHHSGPTQSHKKGDLHPKEPSHKPANMQKHMAKMNKMMVDHLGGSDKEFERRFIDMMIPHHEGAIMMAQHALKNATRPEVKAQAKKMIEDQSKEIGQLKQWRTEWYGQ